MASQVLFSAAAQDVHTAATTAAIAVGEFKEVTIDITQSVITGGASPTVTYTRQRGDAFANWYNEEATAAIPAAGGPASLECGAGLSNKTLGTLLRLSWAVAGAPTAVTAAITVTGKD